MGTDIHGWVEVNSLIGWYAVVNAGWLLDRDYRMFGSLFGVRNNTEFTPLASLRGLPENATAEARRVFGDSESYHSLTYITLRELRSVDWDELALDGRASGRENGDSEVCEATVLEKTDPRRIDGATWEEGKIVFSVKAVSRKESLGASGNLVLNLMETLSARYSEDEIRLVVYFDN